MASPLSSEDSEDEEPLPLPYPYPPTALPYPYPPTATRKGRRRDYDYSEALRLGEVDVTYGRVMMIGAGGAGKTSLRHGLMNNLLPAMAFSTLLANSLRVKCQWAGVSGQRWTEIAEEDEINELATLLITILEKKSLLQSVESASAIKQFQPFTQPHSRAPESARSSSSDHSDIVEELRHEVFTRVRQAKLHRRPHSEVLLNVWDSGGQVVFMNVLPAFLTKRTLFMLVFNASQDLEAKLKVNTTRAGKIVHTEDYHLNTVELLLQWMASIDAHLCLRKDCAATLEPYPRVMLVGTHLDQLVSKGGNPAKVLESLYSQYKDKRYEDLVMPFPRVIVDNTTAGQDKEDEDLLMPSPRMIDENTTAGQDKEDEDSLMPSSVVIVDNTTAGQDKEDPHFQTIRECVRKFATTNFTVPTPITWVLFRKVMQTISQANKPVMRYSEVVAVAEACSVPISTIPSVLNFYHELGVFLYYSKIPSLREVVIATPQWLVNHIAKLLTPHGLEDHGQERHWRLLRREGILTETLYEEVLKHSILPPQALVDLLEDFSLIVPIKTADRHHYGFKEYFVPCMLNAPSQTSVLQSSNSDETSHMAEPMHLIFDTHYVPPGFYVRLLAAVAKNSCCQVLFQQINRFTVSVAYQVVDKITLREHPDSIEVQVTRGAQKFDVPPFTQVCQNIFMMIEQSISEVEKWLPGVCVSTAFVCSTCSPKQPKHFVKFGKDSLTTTPVRCQHEKVQVLGQCKSQQYWLKMQEQRSTHSGSQTKNEKGNSLSKSQFSNEVTPSPTSMEMTNWEYQTMSSKSSRIIGALADNSLANILADELRSRKLIGAAVHAKATNYGPGITEYSRVQQIITSMLSKIEHNPQRYYDFINVLQLDRISVDAEAALALLPTGPPQEH